MRKIVVLIAASGLLTVSGLLPVSAGAHEGQKNPEVRYRHFVMESMSNDFAAMAMIFKNEVDRPDEMQVLARSLAESASLIAGLFPAGSEGASALPLIWEEPERVQEASRESAATAAALAEAAAGDDRAALGKAFAAAGAACKGCHERYKAEDE
ncbi:MAG: cytochrome c [Gammaproteobacteria bacterium]|nr:cytochrome c [Gammaproteobacteria bacterium]NND53952.1 cytochrome c [Gammaproteobacteria bacterium]